MIPVRPAIVATATLDAGEMYDLLGQRAAALERYHRVIQIAPGSIPARAAARFLDAGSDTPSWPSFCIALTRLCVRIPFLEPESHRVLSPVLFIENNT